MRKDTFQFPVDVVWNTSTLETAGLMHTADIEETCTQQMCIINKRNNCLYSRVDRPVTNETSKEILVKTR